MKIVFESYEGKVNVEHQSKYIIRESENFYEIESFSVWNSGSSYVRISKELLKESDFANIEKIGELELNIWKGCYDNENCQVSYKGKWYSGKTINKIQNANKDYDWEKYV